MGVRYQCPCYMRDLGGGGFMSEPSVRRKGVSMEALSQSSQTVGPTSQLQHVFSS